MKKIVLVLVIAFLFYGCIKEDNTNRINHISKLVVSDFLHGHECFKKIQTIGVLPITNDLDGFLTSNLKEHITSEEFKQKGYNWNIQVVAGSPELSKVLNELRLSMKHNKRYDSDTVKKIGQFVDYKYVIHGEVISSKMGRCSSNMMLRGSIFDLETGGVLFEKNCTKEHTRDLTRKECFVLIGVALACLLALLITSLENIIIAYPLRLLGLWTVSIFLFGIGLLVYFD